jgi:hypothetical protein
MCEAIFNTVWNDQYTKQLLGVFFKGLKSFLLEIIGHRYVTTTDTQFEIHLT